MDDMNDTGTKMTTNEKVVAMTARPMSAVASRAASNGRIFFSSTNRKTFSSTTMASSMTMPTMSTRASMVTPLSVKPSAHITPKADTTEGGMGMGAMSVERRDRMMDSAPGEAGMVQWVRCRLV